MFITTYRPYNSDMKVDLLVLPGGGVDQVSIIINLPYSSDVMVAHPALSGGTKIFFLHPC